MPEVLPVPTTEFSTPRETAAAILTIAIPTYNRNSVLAANLEGLLPQLTNECILTILDNASDTPVSQTLAGIEDRTRCAVSVVRNPLNIGGNANIVRCLETSTTGWIWILGDDDPIKPGAVATILNQIRSSPECLYINFRSGLCGERPKIRRGRGISEFAEALDSFSNALFISTCIFNAAELRHYVSFGYLFAYSCAPHLAVLFSGMKEDGEWSFSDEEIVGVVTSKTVDQKWSPLTPALGKMLVLELPMAHRARRILARKLSRRPRLEYLVLSLVRLAGRRESSEEALFLYRQLCARLFWSDRSISGWVRRVFGAFLIRQWRITNWLADLMRRNLKDERWDLYKGMIDQAGVDQWHRM